jgi:hypothetical protein
MRVRHPLLVAYSLNALSWIIFWTWLMSSTLPAPASPAGYVDLVDQPIIRDIYAPSGPPHALETLFTIVQFPSIMIGIALIPTYSTNQYFLGVSFFVWRLLLTTVLSFLQWYGLVWLIGNLRAFVRKQR